MSDYVVGKVVLPAVTVSDIGPGWWTREQDRKRAAEITKVSIDGHVMPPSPTRDKEIAMIICGHTYIQAWPEDKQAEFECFIREVVRTVV